MKTALFTAHPASWGFTHKIAEIYKKVQEENGAEVRIINLYDSQYSQEFLKFEDIKKDCGPTPTKNMIQEHISWADEMVFVAPVWQMGVPAVMKNFFDTNFSAGFAFKYTKDGLVKLLSGKNVRFFLTADGPAWIYWIYAPILRYLTLGGFLYSYAGTKILSVTVFTSMFKKRNDKDRKKMLEAVEKLARKSIRARL